MRLLALLTLLLARAAGADPAGPWEWISAARERLLEDSPAVVAFEQEYLPAGFSSGDRERGRLALGLPDCLRWDYDEPYPKSFLLCGAVGWSWNPGESSGRRFALGAEEERGLELLRLRAEELSQSYAARVTASGGGRVEIELDPLSAQTAMASASLVLDAESRRPLELAYRDREGSLTRFELRDFRPAESAAELFLPPSDIEWLED